MSSHDAFGGAQVYSAEYGEFVSENHQHIAQVIKDYNPYLDLCFIPERDREPTDPAPYAVVYSPPGKEPQVVMWAQHADINETLLAKLWQSDTTKNDPMAYLEALEAARQALIMEKQIEESERAQDMAEFMIRSPLHTINLGKGRKVRT